MRTEARVGLEAGKDMSQIKAIEMAASRLDDRSIAGAGKGRRLPMFSADASADPRCVSLARPASYENGRYLELRSSLEQKRPAGKGLVVAVTSPAAGDGKSLTSSNLAGAFAQNPSLRVLLIDADLRRRSESLRRYLGVAGDSRPGLTDTLCEDNESFDDSLLHVTRHPNLSVILRGTREVDVYETLASARFGAFLEYIRGFYHYVILDIAPVLPVPDHSAIAEWVDGFVMVVTAQRTPRSVLAEAMRDIGPEKLMGLVLNQCEPLPQRYYGYYGAYGDEDPRAGKRRRVRR